MSALKDNIEMEAIRGFLKAVDSDAAIQSLQNQARAIIAASTPSLVINLRNGNRKAFQQKWAADALDGVTKAISARKRELADAYGVESVFFGEIKKEQ